MRAPRTIGVFMAIACCLAAATADPPKVVKAVPDNGDVNVDPSLREIRVTFDQDMSRQGFSWCGGGDSFPEVFGRPGWDGPRTAVLHVRLKPNHQYHLSVNCPSAGNFKSAKGESAAPYPLSFRTGAGSGAPAKTGPNKADQAESYKLLREGIMKQYSYRDLRVDDWAARFDEYKDRLTGAKSAAEFAREAAELLAPAKDIHMFLKANDQSFPTFRRNVPPNGDFRALPKIVPAFKQHNRVVSTGRFEDGIGYILIANWSGEDLAQFEPAFAALEDFADAPGLIIDVRFNSGGSETIAQQLAGCFVTAPKIYAQHVYVDPASKSGFSAESKRKLERTKGRPRYRGKVAVLTGPHVMSSCEAFLLMMKCVRGAKLVGATSYGASGNPKPFVLPNGVTVFVPSWKAMTADGEEFEGKGIEPDIAVETKPGDFGDQDPVIEAALKYLRG